MPRLIVALLFVIAIGSLTACASATATATEPKWNGEVRDTDPCQPVREQKMGGVTALCKGTCPSEASTCGTLQARPRGSDNEWQNDEGDLYDGTKEYRCLCRR